MVKSNSRKKKRKNKDISHLELTEEMKEIIDAKLLGDSYGSISNDGTKGTFTVYQQFCHTSYVLDIYRKFVEFCLKPPKWILRYTSKKNSNMEQKRVQSMACKFSTRKHKGFAEHYHRFYQKEGINGELCIVKRVPRDLKLTDRMLAYWVMDDGARHNSGLRLHTQSFPLEDGEFLQKTFPMKP